MTARPTHPQEQSECPRIQRAIEASFDGEASAADEREIETHLGRCAACGVFAQELQAVRDAMAGLPVEPFDDDALEAVWDRTIRTAERRVPFAPRWARAAAALVAVAAVTVVLVRMAVSPGPEDPAMSEQELAQLDAEVQEALLIVSDALGRAERIAVVDVLARRTSDVIDIVPLDRGGTTVESTWSIP